MSEGDEISTQKSTFELELTGYAYGGEAIGRAPDGRMIFVAFGAPGETVRVELIESHERWARAVLLEVLKPSHERVEPRCQHYGVCGGCHYQHLSYAEQLAAKRAIIVDQLARIGGLPQAQVLPTIGAPQEWNYRNHLQFRLDSAGSLSFSKAHSQELLPIQECHLPEPALNALWPQIEIEPLPALDRIAIRSFDPDEQLVILHGQGEPDFELEIDLPGSVAWLSPELATVLAGDGHLAAEVNGRDFIVSAGSFFQVNSWLTPTLVEVALGALQLSAGQTCLDLYAGVGLFSAFIAEAGARVIAVEESPWGARDFELNLAAFDSIELYEGAVEQVLPQLQEDPHSILVDPPRAGLGRAVVDQITRLAPDRLVYVSCDPATLARDANQLAAAGYKLLWVQPLDMFPQTYHIESVSLLQPMSG